MIDIIAKIFLSFTNDTLLIPILVLGFIWLNRKICYHAICLLLFSMLYCSGLKVYFQIYSPIYGLIFPSGHMLASTVLYGWLAYRYNNLIFTSLIGCLLTGIGISLVYFNYHDYYDVIGGVFFAMILLLSYSLALIKKPQIILKSILILSSCIILYIYIYNHKIASHLWLAYYTLIGFTISTKTFKHLTILTCINHKIIASIFCFFSIFMIKYIFSFFTLPVYLFQLQWLLIGIALPTSCFIMNFISNQNDFPKLDL